MQAAADAQPSSMAAIIGLSSDKCEELCKVASEQKRERRASGKLFVQRELRGEWCHRGDRESRRDRKTGIQSENGRSISGCRRVSHGFHETCGGKVRETVGGDSHQRDENTGHFQRRHATTHGRGFDQKDVSDASDEPGEMGRVHAKVDRGRFGRWHGSWTRDSHLDIIKRIDKKLPVVNYTV